MSNPCVTPDPCVPCTPTYTDLGCTSFPNSECIIYNGDDIPCLSIVKTENLNEVLQHLKDVICALTPTAYEDFDYDCFSTVGITTEQQFVEFISSTLCEVLGSQSVGSLTSLSDLNSLIAALTVDVNLIKNQTLISCFQTLSGLSTPQTISVLLTAIQTILCDHEDRINALEIAGGLALTANDSTSIDFTTSGTLGHTLTGSVILSPNANNSLTNPGNGLFVTSPVITPTNTNSINLTVYGVLSHTLQADVKISATSGNILTVQADGLLAKPSPIDAQDSATINFTNINDYTFTGVVKIDPDISNILTATGSGLLVTASSFALSNNSVTDAILRDSAGYSVIGRTSGSTGDPADIVAGSDTVLRRSGSGNLSFGTIVTNNIGADQVTFEKTQNISSARLLGRSTAGSGDIEQITVGTGLTLAGGDLSADFTALSIEGTYTPNLTNVTNVAASTAYTTYYTSVGNTVTIWGDVDIDATAATTLTVLRMSLPPSVTLATAFSNTFDLAGTAAFQDGTSVQIRADTGATLAEFRFTPVADTNNKYSFHFTYKVIAP